ncbi:protein KRI1 homolog [Anastrepha ludens]|uniref:protein KRI1 homolog n=1 Tax=Anastrepha ludens TaxID=28586 RepID=UPI0023AFF6D2|nr:protein KRI1 homolog [Anastrepha ludens]XP_053955390.1 protein KRI1 homolog [Anastrepha ludens]
MSKNLFDGSDESDGEELQLSTNKEYAKSYNDFRKKELLKKFKDRGYDVDSESSSDSETSSDENEVVDQNFDKEFLKTLASLKSKDPAIYDKNTTFFQALNRDTESDGETENNIQIDKRSKPVTLKDYERQIILEKGGKFEEDSDEEVPKRTTSPTFVEEERNLKEEFKKAINTSDLDENEEEDAFGGIFKKRNKTTEEQEKEDADYLKWLAGKKDDIEDTIKETLKPLKNYWSNNKLPQSERFLRDFILNKGYADTKSSDIPTYDEIIGDNQPLSEDEKELEKQAEFEQKFNFRFEEPDADFIKRYPRTIEQSVRQSDDRRKQKRQEVKERKKHEKEQKMKELDMVKEMKRKEIEEKIRKIKLVTGNEELGFKDEELEDDFDPEAHDKRMQEIFNDEFYEVDEGEEKPDCPSDIDELKIEDWDNFDPNEEDGEYFNDPHCEDEDFNMDCDYDPESSKEQLQKELIENTKKRKGRKGRKSEFKEMIKAVKPAFDPEDEKTYEEYIDEYYKLDCEDMIGDIPCRFKYIETTPNDFGLTIEEILLAKNKELNQWASLKKTIQIRPEHLEKKDQRLYKLKAKNEALKRKVFKSLYGEGSDEDEGEEGKQNVQDLNEQSETVVTSIVNQGEGDGSNKKANKKKKRKIQTIELSNETSDSAENFETADNKSNLMDNAPTQSNGSVAAPVDIETKNKKKRKKRKAKTNSNEITAKCSPATTPGSEVNSSSQKKSNINNNKTNPFRTNQHTNTNDQPSTKSTTAAIENATNDAQFSKSKPLKPNPFQGNQKNIKKGTLHAISEKKNKHFVANKVQKRKSQPNQRKFNQNSKSTNGGANISDERLKAYGINPKKFHKKQKYGKPQN